MRAHGGAAEVDEDRAFSALLRNSPICHVPLSLIKQHAVHHCRQLCIVPSVNGRPGKVRHSSSLSCAFQLSRLLLDGVLG